LEIVTGDKKDSKVKHVKVPNERDGQRLDNFVAAQLPGLPRSALYRVIRKGQVRINGGRAKPHTRLQGGDEVRIPPAQVSVRRPNQVSAQDLDRVRAAIQHEHDDYLLIDKPAGIAVHGGSGISWSLIDAIRALYPQETPELVHRLDRDTSGCLLVARHARSLRHLRTQFRDKSAEKRYLCLTQGRFKEDRLTVDQPLARFERSGERFMEVSEHGKPSVTEFRLLEHYGRQSFVEAVPVTGRTHQIRVHAAWLGIPLAGDRKYSNERSIAYWKSQGLDRLFLHAHGLSFDDEAGERQQFHVPLPTELRRVLDVI
jgi:23S rRNA pseudouridine955/2504/2580 synthase